MEKKTVLVIGGAGFIGSHVNKMIHQAGYDTVVLDNLSTGNQQTVVKGTFYEGDLSDKALLHTIFTSHTIDAVMHFAAFINVGESVFSPLKYYENNVSKTIQLLQSMQEHHVKFFIFSSSAAVYGTPQTLPVNELHPCVPINPYGQTKWMVEKILNDVDSAYGIKSSCLRYFNAAGGDPEGEIKNYNKYANNLIPIILRSLKKQPPTIITIFGTDYSTHDGTCIRDYIHVCDLAAAHITALEQLWKGASSSHYNLGNSRGHSVKEVIEAAEHITGIRVNASEGLARQGDPPVLIADSSKARQELGWQPRYPDLETIVAHAWQALN